jgi:hypothetical protein
VVIESVSAPSFHKNVTLLHIVKIYVTLLFLRLVQSLFFNGYRFNKYYGSPYWAKEYVSLNGLL